MLMDEDLKWDKEAYIIELVPRGFDYVDAIKSQAIGVLTGYAVALEDEKSAIGLIDSRDIISISVYRKGKFIEKHNNPKFIQG